MPTLSPILAFTRKSPVRFHNAERQVHFCMQFVKTRHLRPAADLNVNAASTSAHQQDPGEQAADCQCNPALRHTPAQVKGHPFGYQIY